MEAAKHEEKAAKKAASGGGGGRYGAPPIKSENASAHPASDKAVFWNKFLDQQEEGPDGMPQDDNDRKNMQSRAAARPGVVAYLTPAVVNNKKEMPPAASPADQEAESRLLSSVDEKSKEKTSMAKSAEAQVPRPSYRTEQEARKQQEQKTATKRSDAMASVSPPADPGLQPQFEQTADESGPAPPAAVPQLTSVGSAARPPGSSNLERGDHYVRPGAVAMPGIGRRDDDDDDDSSFSYDPAQFEDNEAAAAEVVEAQATALDAVPRDGSSGRDLTKEDGSDAKKGFWKSRRTWIVVGGLVAVVAVVVVVVAIVAGGGGGRDGGSETSAPTARPITVAPTTAPPTAQPIPRTQAPIAPVASPPDSSSTIHLLDFLSVYFVQFGHFFDCAEWDLPLEVEFQCIQNNQPQPIEIFGHQASGTNAKQWNIVCETDFSALGAFTKCAMDNPAAPESFASGEIIFMVGCGSREAGSIIFTATTSPMITRECPTGATAGLVVGAACFPEGTQTGSNGQPVWDLRLQGPGGCGLATTEIVRLDTTPTSQPAATVRTLDVCASKSLCTNASPCPASVSPFSMDYNNAANDCYMTEKKQSALGEFDWDVAAAWALVNQSFYVSDFGSKNHGAVIKINT